MLNPHREVKLVGESVYKVIELVGSSEKSWEDAVQGIIDKAAKTLRDLRIAEVVRLDCKIAENKIVLYRARVKLSFKYEGG
ncbi:MAG: dodecin family protein [Promethearchaeota archaeon]